jgi:hypothetical protein
MKHLLQLATVTLNLEEVGDVEERDDCVIIFFGSDNVPEQLILTGDDADMMRRHLHQEVQHSREALIQSGLLVPDRPNPTPPPLVDTPPF